VRREHRHDGRPDLGGHRPHHPIPATELFDLTDIYDLRKTAANLKKTYIGMVSYSSGNNTATTLDLFDKSCVAYVQVVDSCNEVESLFEFFMH
jgi:hypothetical protein